MRIILLGLLLGLAASCAYAQTAPSPADVGIVHGNPDVFKLLDSSKTWTPFGSVDPTTHIFTPVGGGGGGGGAINVPPAGTTPINGTCPNGQFLYNNAGAVDCVAVSGGGATGALTLYPTHALLTSGVTAPASSATVYQQGFYAPGDGGDVAYQWNSSSYCPGGTSSVPTAADTINCVLPIGQAPSTAGRYLLATSGTVNVRQVGMQPGGQDNSPYVQALMDAVGPPNLYGTGAEIVFPPVPGQYTAYYYFSQPFELSRPSRINCRNVSANNQGAVILMFAPGVSGIVQAQGYTSPDGGWGQSDVSGCALMSLGGGAGTASSTSGTNTITGISMDNDLPPGSSIFTPPSDCNPVGSSCTFGVGDGIIAIEGWEPVNSSLAVDPGAYVATSNPSTGSVTLASPYLVKPLHATPGLSLYNLPVKQKYTVQTTIGSPIVTVTNGPRLLQPGDMIWSDAWPFGSTVIDTNNAIVGTPTVHVGGSGYVGSSGTMTWNGPGCSAGYNHPPVLNVTASGGVITGVASVADAGQCIQSTPPSGVANWTPGGGLSGGSGASFNTTFQQTSNIVNITMYTYVNASVNHTSGAPGQMWTIPAGVVRQVSANTHNADVRYFPFGLRGDCMTGSTPPMGCNASLDTRDTILRALVGKMMRGNAAGVSTSLANVFADNTIVDEAELGSIGSTYFSEEYNSPEDGSSIYAMLAWCDAQNYSVWYGPYLTDQPPETCIGVDANGNAALGVAAKIAEPPAAPLVIGSVYGGVFPYITSGNFGGSWRFNGSNTFKIGANAASAAGSTTIYLNTIPSLRAGLSVTDLTNPVIPDGTTTTAVGYGILIISNPITGGGVQAGDIIQLSGDTACMEMNPGLSTTESTGLLLDAGCTFSGGLPGLVYDGANNAWDLNIPGGVVTANTTIVIPVAVASLPACSSGSNAGAFASVNNGVAIGTAGYGAVVSATGAITRAVFCDGTSWAYH